MPRSATADSVYEQEYQKLLAQERAKEKIKKYKIACTVIEAKKGLDDLTTKDGRPVENAVIFNQWMEKFMNWAKTVNVYWVLDPDTSLEKKEKHKKQFDKAVEVIYICLCSAIKCHVALAVVQDKAINQDGCKALKALKAYFLKEKDEINLEEIEEDLHACKPAKGETVESWLNRLKQFELLLSTTERKKTDSEMLTIIKRNLPKEFADFKAKFALKEGVHREKYCVALRKWAQYIRYPRVNNQSAEEQRSGGTALPAKVVEKKETGQEGGTMPKSGNPCQYCGKGHPSAECWKKFPELKPEWAKKREEKHRAARDANRTTSAKGLVCSEGPKGQDDPGTTEHKRWNLALISAPSDHASQDTSTGEQDATAMAEVCEPASSTTHTSSESVMSTLSAQTQNLTGSENDEDWILDSGATSHITPNRRRFLSYTPNNDGRTILTADGKHLQIKGQGRVALRLDSTTQGMGTLTLEQVQHVPEAKFNLVSLQKIVSKGGSFDVGQDEGPRLKLPGGITLRLVERNGLYCLGNTPPDQVLLTREADLNHWHERLGHRSKDQIKRMAQQQLVKGLKINLQAHSGCSSKPCPACAIANLKKMTVPKVTLKRSTIPNHRVFMDMTGYYMGEDGKPITFQGGTKVFMVFVDDATRRSRYYELKDKTSESFLAALQTYIAEVGEAMVILRSDGAHEFEDGKCQEFYQQHRIKREITPANSPQYNGVAERNIQTVFRSARAMRVHAQVPIRLANYAVKYAEKIYNCMPTKGVNQERTPHEAWTGEKPDVSKFRVFGCQCWTAVNRAHPAKLADRAREGVFLGFPDNQKGSLIYIPATKRIVVSKDVIFDEQVFPFRSSQKQESFPQEHETIEVEEIGTEAYIADTPRLEEADEEVLRELRTVTEVPRDPPEGTLPDLPHDLPEPGDDMAPNGFKESEPDSATRTRYGRTIKAPNQFWMTATNSTAAISLAAIENEVIKARDIYEPVTYEDAMRCEDAAEWQESILREVNTLLANDTFEIVSKNTVPQGRKIVKSKWVFKNKKDKSGNLLSHKTRLVAKGFTEIPGVDYFEIFHPVGQGQTFRLLVAKSAKQGRKLYHVDIKGAFLHATLDEEIYLELPKGTGLGEGNNPVIVKLKKSLYGLKQAGRDWFLALSAVLRDIGFQQSPVDPCLLWHPRHDTYVMVYVDDLLISVQEEKSFKWFVSEVSKKFEVGSAEPAQWYLGIRINQQGGVITLDQRAGVEDLIHKYGMQDCNTVTTPAVPNSKLEQAKPGEPETHHPYRSLVGALLFLSVHTRPDIQYAVNELTKHCEHPTERHWESAKRVLRYLQGTLDYQLCYRASADMTLHAACDADWACNWKGQGADAKSITGYVCWIAGGVVSAKAKRQTTVALSTCESEYVAIAAAAQEVIYLRQLLKDLHEPQEEPTTILCDNNAARELTEKETHQQRTKHIAIRYHFVREAVRRKELVVKRIDGKDNPADLFTKPLPPITFKKHIQHLFG